MQPYPQDPNQGGYPRFDQPQPGVQPGFAIQHNNPYAQPAPGQAYIPPTQYGDPQAYIPPTQYGDPQAFPAIPQQDNLVTEMEVRQIDQHLSSGWWACYNCYLYFIAIGGILTALQGITFTLVWIPYIFLIAEGACSTFYAITMLDALKNKNLQKAELGVQVSLACAVCLCGVFFANFTVLFSKSDFVSALVTECITAIPSSILIFFIIINPAMRIKGHLERREAVLQKGSNPYNV